MGYQGHAKIRPVHLEGLAKRYRQILGKIRYYKKRQQRIHTGLSELEHALKILAVTLKAIDPNLDLATLKAIPFRPPEVLTDQALTRDILSILRLSDSPLSPSALYDALLLYSELGPIEDLQESRLRLRIKKITTSLMDRNVLNKIDGRFYIQP